MATRDAWEPYRPPLVEVGPAETTDEVEEAASWQRWIADRDLAARNALVLQYKGYARAQAAKLYARRPRDACGFDEYEQFAMVGLLEAIDRYQLGRGAQFTTYATPRIRGAILSGLQHLSERQEQMAWRRRVVRERAAALAAETLPNARSPQLLEELLGVASGLALGILLDGSGMMVGPNDSLPGNAYAQVELRQLRDQLLPLLDRLTDREREVIRLHYLESRSFGEIVTILKLSKGRVSQLHRQGLARLRALFDKSKPNGPVFL